MARADSGTGPGAQTGRRWDVALSFAGAQRDYVEQVAQSLKARGVRCFYDADEQVRLWGTHLAEELPRIYAYESSAVVVFISAEYTGRDWTRLERRAAFSEAVAEAGVYVLPARFDDSDLPGLLPDVAAVDLRRYSPGQFADLVVEKLADLSISSSLRAVGVDRVPAGGVRVSEVDPRRLGVHAAISVPEVADEILPEYVPRDVDSAEFGVRAQVAAAAERGGFVLLVGGSSVGKTRCAAEAVRALLPDWWLVHPAGPAQVNALVQVPAPRTVVWLDELQRYLDGEHGLTGGVIRALLNPPHPALIIGTLWPDRHTAYTTVPAPGGTDPHAREREVLDLATVIRINAAFSGAEQGRARAAATRDLRLKIALGVAGYGLTQTLAAAPQLVTRWENAQSASPYAWAVLAAALDMVRLGASAPLSTGLLRAAAPGYCTSQQQAEAPDNWFEQALSYATGKLYGAAAALTPVGVGMGQLVGYTVAEYLIQYGSRERRDARVPASTWAAVVDHVRDPADTARLADSARTRLLYRYAIPLYLHAANTGDRYAARRLADLLAEIGDLDGLRGRAGTGDRYAAWRLIDLLAKHGDLDGAARILRARADVGDEYAAGRLADLLAETGDLDGLRGRADAGDEYAAGRLADLLAEAGDLDGLRGRADAGDKSAASRLAGLLAETGDLDGAARILRARADAGDKNAASRLAELLAETGDLDELRARADAGDRYAASWLAGLLAKHGDLDGAAHILRARADAGDRDAASWLADLLAEHGDLDGLRARADAGDWYAPRRLAVLLAETGDLGGAAQILRACAVVGDEYAAQRLADLLAETGDLEGLSARAGTGDEYAASWLADLLAKTGDLDALRARADTGDRHAARRMAGLLAEHGDLDGLCARADAGDRYAASRVADLLAKHGDLDGLRARADTGDRYAALRLVGLLAEHRDLDGLRARVDAGDRYAASRLVGLLTKQGRGEEAGRLRRFGLNPDGSIACG